MQYYSNISHGADTYNMYMWCVPSLATTYSIAEVGKEEQMQKEKNEIWNIWSADMFILWDLALAYLEYLL